MLLEVLIKLRDIFGGRVSVVFRVWLLEKLKTEVLISYELDCYWLIFCRYAIYVSVFVGP